MHVHVFNEQSILSLDIESVQQCVKAMLEFAHKKCDEVSIHFVEEEEICHLHEEYFNDPSPTDCISFPMDQEEEMGPTILGEVFISPQAALDYAHQHKCDPYEELTLYLVHGLLHLLGFDDIEEEDEKKMREQEKIHLDHLKLHSVYLEPKY